jgi:GNAT superfamily N-acetyltransferase
MKHISIRKAFKSEGKQLLSLIDQLAKYEKLKKPTKAAKERLLRDAFGKRKKFTAFLAFTENRAVGYAIILDTYSSFLALPTLYLEDIFVLPDYRKLGIGLKLFRKCLQEARRRGCGRMEWVVLDWNKNAIHFYDKLGARHLSEWFTYRLESRQFNSILAKI